MSEPLRILHFNSLLTGGGTDEQCIAQASGLHQLGLSVRLAGPPGRGLAERIVQAGVPFYAMAKEGLGKLSLIWELARLLRRERIQILHSHHGRDIWPTILAAKLSGVRPKIVLTRHMAKSPSSWPSRHFLLSQCDALIAVSEFTARVLREGVYEPNAREVERRARPPVRGDHTKIHVLHGGIDTERFRPLSGPEIEAQRREWGVAPEHFVFAVAGSYDRPRGKGQREFLQAAAQIHEAIPHARFLIVGRGNLADTLRADIERLGLTGKAWLTAYGSDMPCVMNALDCLVHPQVGTEAFGLVVCEAHACGKPVIASALDGIPEAFAVGAWGTLVSPDHVPELARAMRDQAYQAKVSEAFRQELWQRMKSNCSVEVVAQQLAKFYLKLLQPHV